MGKSFAEVHPELVGEWSHKNGLMRPEDITIDGTSGYTYIFSPYKLIWNGDYYYVVGYSEKHRGIRGLGICPNKQNGRFPPCAAASRFSQVYKHLPSLPGM